MEMLNQNRLRYFNEIYQRGSITRAAIALNTDPSVITRQIKILEEELGTRLFERGKRGRGMTPTEAAELVFKYYRSCRTHQDELEIELQEMREMKRGSISIVISDSYIEALVEEILNHFCIMHPRLSIRVDTENSSPRVIAKILDDSAHIGILHSPIIDEPNIHFRYRTTLPIYFLTSPNHPLANRKKVSLLEVSQYPLALSPPQSSLGHLIYNVAAKENIQFNPALISSSVPAKIKFVTHTRLSGTFVSTFAARKEIQLGQLIPIEVDCPEFMTYACLIARRSRPLSPALNQLIRLLEDEFSLFWNPSAHAQTQPCDVPVTL